MPILQLAQLKRYTSGLIKVMPLMLWFIIAAYPFLWIIMSSLKTRPEYYSDPLGFPSEPQWWHFAHAWKQMRIERYFMNSVFVSVMSMLGVLILSSAVAFIFARFNFRFKKLLWGFLILSFLLPETTALFPLFIFSQKVGIYGSLWALVIIYSAKGVPWNAFFLRAHIETIPRELDEASICDGATTWQVFLKVIIPLSLPALATLGIYHFIFVWGDFMLPIMLAESDSVFTVAVGVLFLTTGRGGTNPPLIAAGVLISIIPLLLIYIFMQRYVIKGLTAGAIKG